VESLTPSYLSPDSIKQVAKSLVFSWRFWLPFFTALLLGYLSILKIVGTVAERQTNKFLRELGTNTQARLNDTYKEMTNRIRLEFQEPNVSNIVAWGAASQASNLLQNAVMPQIERFSLALSNSTQKIEQKATGLEIRLEQFKKASDTVESSLRRLQRSIPSDKKDEVIKALTALPKTVEIQVISKGTLPEATVFAQELHETFKISGFKTDLTLNADAGLPQPYGERIHINNLTNFPSEGIAIQRLLQSLGFGFPAELNPSVSNNVMTLFIWNKPPY